MSNLLDQVIVFRIFATNFACLTSNTSVPTRVTASTKTLLDVILVSHPERFVSSGTLRLGINDHDLIYIVRITKTA